MWMQVFQQSVGTTTARRRSPVHAISLRHLFQQFFSNLSIRWFPKNNFLKPTVPSPSSLHGPSSRTLFSRQSSSIIPKILASFASIGPLLSRLVAQGILASPMITITLQRDSVQVGGNI